MKLLICLTKTFGRIFRPIQAGLSVVAIGQREKNSIYGGPMWTTYGGLMQTITVSRAWPSPREGQGNVSVCCVRVGPPEGARGG